MLTDFFISYPKQVAGVEIFFHGPDNYELRAVVVSYSKKRITIEQCIGPVSNVQELLKYIKTSTPIYLTITGKMVLARKDDLSGKSSTEGLFLGINKEEFYTESAGDSYMFMIRNRLLSEIIAWFSKEGYKPSGITIGPLIIQQSLSLLKLNTLGEEIINTGNIKLIIFSNEVRHFEYVKTNANPMYEFQHSEEQIASAFLIAYSTALLPYIGYTFKANAFFDTLKLNQDFWKYRLFIKKNASIFCFILFLVLAINGVFYFHLFDQHLLVKQKFRQNEFLIKRLDSLKQEVALQDKFMKANGMDTSKPYISFYADRIAHSIPTGILLTNMVISPVSINKENDTKEYSYDNKRIKIKGTSTKEISLNQWVKQMNNLSFVNDVAINSINKDINNETFFEIEVLLK